MLLLLFAVAYSQAPLYHSNQNSYLLRGLASASFGQLDRDWLAKSADPTPVFSMLVAVTHRWLFDGMFYVFHAALVIAYASAILSIALNSGVLKKRRDEILLFLAVFTISHAAILGAASRRLLGTSISELFHGGVAGQYLLGSSFQPSAFGSLLVVSVALFLTKRAFVAAALLVVVPTLHPTYLLGGAFLALGYSLALLLEGARGRAVGSAAIYFVGVTPIVAYTLMTFAPTSAANRVRAHEILAVRRIPHHALVSHWFDEVAVFKIIWVGLALWFSRKSRLLFVLAVPFVATIALTSVQVLRDDLSLALMFPWRPSTYLVPLSTAVILARATHSVTRTSLWRWLSERNVARSLCLCAMVVSALGGVAVFGARIIRDRTGDEFEIMQEARARGDRHQLYLVPSSFERFRLATGLPILVDHKSPPYRDEPLLEWWQRLALVEGFEQSENAVVACERLDDIVRVYGVTHVIAEQKDLSQCSQLTPLATAGRYSLYARTPADSSELSRLWEGRSSVSRTAT